MKYITIFGILVIVSILPALAQTPENALPTCQEQMIFYLHQKEKNTLTLSNMYCNFGIPFQKTVQRIPKKLTPNTLVLYSEDLNAVQSFDVQNEALFVRVLQKLLTPIMQNDDFRNELQKNYINNFLDYQYPYAQIVKKLVFSPEEQAEIQKGIDEHPYQFFVQTHGQRLLMDGKIISREQWWADETYAHRSVYMADCDAEKCRSGGPIPANTLRENYLKTFYTQDQKERIIKTFDNGRDPMVYYPVDRIIIHHTAGGYKANREEGIQYMQDVHKYHGLKLRWWDVGYHYLIDGAGNIYEGRAGGKYVLWAHVSVHNYGTVGISLMSDGYYSPEMLDALDELIIYLADEYRLDLTGVTRVRNHDLTAWIDNGWALIAHKELDSRKPKDPEIDMEVLRYMLKQKVLKRNQEKTRK